MARDLIVSIDAMGGDAGPGVVVAALMRASQRHPEVRFLLAGDETVLVGLLARHARLKERVTLRHAPDRVAMADKPSHVLRRGRGTSMWRAIEAVKTGEAEVAVSAGNTGALMAMAMVQLGIIEGVSRPAIASIWPTLRGQSVVLDCGANVSATGEQLVDFAVMGGAFARAILGLEKPSVGILNVGSEEQKGNDGVKAAAQILRGADLPMIFYGFIEGNDIAEGTVDVVVTDGFTGNIALKTAEGTAKLVSQFLRRSLRRSILGRIGAFIASGALNTLRRRLDPRAANGGIFLGLKGVVVKSHGGTDAIGFASALDMAIAMAKADINAAITADRAHVEIRDGDMIRARVIGSGSYLPETVLTNDDLARRINTSDQWIREMTGIRERHVAAPGEKTSDLALAAARAALMDAGIDAGEVDLVIVATTTPDETFPATATVVQARLGMAHGAAFDVQAVCSGFIYGLSIADNMIRGGQARTVLLIGAETMSRILDWTDRRTCVLFGDGAGAVVLQAYEGVGGNSDQGVLNTRLFSDGRLHDMLYTDGGPSSTQTTGFLRMQGKEVFRHAVTNISAAIAASAEGAGLSVSDIDWFVPHQANQRILDGTARKLGISPEKVVSTVGHHGNTSAASVPLALATAVQDGRIRRGHLVLLEAMGGGFTWGAGLIRW